MKRAILAVVAVLCASPSFAQLGSISFPNSGAPEAQQAFLRGVAALHSFWYEEAAEAFREARRIDPEFVMAAWGEAMTHNHPIWMQVDLGEGRAALRRLAPTPPARMQLAKTDRERGLLDAVETLFGEGEKQQRDRAYEAKMQELAHRFPADEEIQAFHALSILGLMRPGEPDARKQVLAAAVLEPLYEKNPEHPGVLHYLIHAYDDPVHAPLGLRAARRYAAVAPAAFHARHMPSHIFLQLGMWSETASSNEQSFGVSKEWVERKSLAREKLDLHSLQWLQYAYLQQNRASDAKKLLAIVAPMEGEGPRERTTRAWMLARQAIEANDWSVLPSGAVSGGEESDAHAACGPVGSRVDSSPLVFATGLAAVARRDAPAARAAIGELETIRAEKDEQVAARTVEVMKLELEASLEASQGRMPRALELAAQAVAIEETLGAPSGPPDTFKPAHEFHGELLLRAGRREEAARAFAASLLRTPNRRASLEGARAAEAADAEAVGER